MTTVLGAEGVHLAYGDVEVLRDVDVTLSPGDRVLLSGDNGSGKSTLLAVLAGALPPDAGTVARPTARVGWGRGGAHLPAGWTVQEVLQLGEPAALAAAERALGSLNGTALLAQPIDSLSAGERQRVDLAWALSRGTAVLLLDEPMEHLDGQARAALLTAIDALPSDVAVVVASHRPDDWTRRLPIGWTLDHGRLVIR